MKNIEKDKRGLERFPLKIQARIKTLDSHKDEDERGIDIKTSNISSGGAFFHTPEPLSEGSDVMIELILPVEKLIKYLDNLERDYRETLIEIKGRVLRSEPEGMVIRFDKGYKITPLKEISPVNKYKL
ncbi:PilZ domain-containing protein [Thermodesulfobacteriota bacterium]